MPTPNDPTLNPGSQSVPKLAAETPAEIRTPGYPRIWWTLLIVFIIAVSGAAWWKALKSHEYGPPLSDFGAVPSFTLTNEKNTSAGLEQLKGRVWVADFIFTRCGGQCPLMTQKMRSFQQWLDKKQFNNVKLVSISVDPENDSPDILAQYAERFKANTDQWSFFTGDRAKIYDLITNGFKLGVDQNKGKPVSEMFVHSDKFVLVDRDGRIRGYFSGVDETGIDKLRQGVTRLSYEPDAADKKGPQA